MLTKRKKIIYIGLIAVAVGASVLILTLGQRPVPVPGPVTTQLPVANKPASSTQMYTAPKVFPTETRFDVSLFRSTVFQTFEEPQEVIIEKNEIGRDNPFRRY